jgi:hypothetical protein
MPVAEVHVRDVGLNLHGLPALRIDLAQLAGARRCDPMLVPQGTKDNAHVTLSAVIRDDRGRARELCALAATASAIIV